MGAVALRETQTFFGNAEKRPISGAPGIHWKATRFSARGSAGRIPIRFGGIRAQAARAYKTREVGGRIRTFSREPAKVQSPRCASVCLDLHRVFAQEEKATNQGNDRS